MTPNMVTNAILSTSGRMPAASITPGEPAIDVLAREHFLLHHQISRGFSNITSSDGGAVTVLELMDRRDAVVKKLLAAGWSHEDLGANALGISRAHFRELVREGTYHPNLGAPVA